MQSKRLQMINEAMRNRPEAGPSSALCQTCAACCKHFAFVSLSPAEIQVLEKYTGLPADGFTHSTGRADTIRFLKFKANGDCFFLHTINGCFACSVYEARAGICRDYPSTACQLETCRKYRNDCRTSASSQPSHPEGR